MTDLNKLGMIPHFNLLLSELNKVGDDHLMLVHANLLSIAIVHHRRVVDYSPIAAHGLV